jgi:hypothetical protein
MLESFAVSPPATVGMGNSVNKQESRALWPRTAMMMRAGVPHIMGEREALALSGRGFS